MAGEYKPNPGIKSALAEKAGRRPYRPRTAKKAEREALPKAYPDGHVKCGQCKGEGHHKKQDVADVKDMALGRV